MLSRNTELPGLMYEAGCRFINFGIESTDNEVLKRMGKGQTIEQSTEAVEACKAAGVPGTAHGLRKAGATRAAENGATEAELEAIFGWEGGRMASLYTRQANRERLSKQAAGKLLNEQEMNAYSRTLSSGAGTNPKSKGKSNA